MQSAILSLAVAANVVAAAGLQPREAVSDAAAFTSAADALISSYIPANEWAALTSAVGSAASAAGVTQDVKDLIYSALKATDAPQWFDGAVPTAYSSQYAALESAIDNLRPTVTVPAPGPVTTVLAVTTTDENGSTIVASVTTTIVPTPTTITTQVVPTPNISVVTGTDSAGNAYTSTIVGTNATESAATTATETVTTGGTATESATVTETGPDATGTEASGTAASGTATGTDAPAQTNAAPTAVANSLAGVAAVVGLVMAL
ncbi:uncharacterized protein CTRU02_208835 [Colletotrichum truncatum]|uniref:Uncharacterized protein n=1 Tax=Colletotrichum truncatum TaxID=5467 RepID=A0ACC3YXG4_COLTU